MSASPLRVCSTYCSACVCAHGVIAELQCQVLTSTPCLCPPTLQSVKPGKARVIKCLMENMGQPNFGEECKVELSKREEAMKNDYRWGGWGGWLWWHLLWRLLPGAARLLRWPGVDACWQCPCGAGGGCLLHVDM